LAAVTDGNKWEACKGTLFNNGEGALVIRGWPNQVDTDASGFIFEECGPTQDADASQLPMAMLINSREFDRKKLPPRGFL